MVVQKTKLRKGDEVVIRTGKSKGATGRIKSIDKEKGQVILEGMNIVRRHMKPSPLNPSGYLDKERPFHISNVSVVDPENGKPSKVGYRIKKDKKKVRFLKSSGKEI